VRLNTTRTKHKKLRTSESSSISFYCWLRWVRDGAEVGWMWRELTRLQVHTSRIKPRLSLPKPAFKPAAPRPPSVDDVLDKTSDEMKRRVR